GLDLAGRVVGVEEVLLAALLEPGLVLLAVRDVWVEAVEDRELRLVDDHGLVARRRRDATLLRLRGCDRLGRLARLGGLGRLGGWRGRGRQSSRRWPAWSPPRARSSARRPRARSSARRPA